MSKQWSAAIPDPSRSGKGQKWQTKLTTWLIQSAHDIWLERNNDRYQKDTIDDETAQTRETEAQIRRVYTVATTNLSIYDQAELLHDTLEERLGTTITPSTIPPHPTRTPATPVTGHPPFLPRHPETNTPCPSKHTYSQFPLCPTGRVVRSTFPLSTRVEDAI